MKIYLFASPEFNNNPSASFSKISSVLEKIANGTDTHDLITAIYLLPGRYKTRGTAYVRDWQTSEQFATGRGHWSISRAFDTPQDLPEQYKLIRIRIDPSPEHYPREERDVYHWKFMYSRFEDHLANLFAHELHHFRRFHLDLHPGEGEQKANKWALNQSTRLGYTVEGTKERVRPKSRKKRIRRIFAVGRAKYKAFSGLKPGHQLIIQTDPKGRYKEQIAILKKPLRKNAKRVVIETSDGKNWRWPVEWLTPHDNKNET